jgi:uncharacterized protein YndB with AHSA1/START domain
MPNIQQDLPIKAPIEKVFAAISTSEGLDQWWSKTSSGTPVVGTEYELGFGPKYQWRAEVTKSKPNAEFELTMTKSDADWDGSRVGFRLEQQPEFVWLRFYHDGWPDTNDHFRISNHCWAMYLRVLRRYLEYGETVEYSRRLDV